MDPGLPNARLRVLQVHNRYGGHSGEEAVVERQTRMLRERGHTVRLFERSSSEIRGTQRGRFKAAFSAIYNPLSERNFAAAIREFAPDIVHVHNLFPLISPGVLRIAGRHGLPVVMSVHNYRLSCSAGLFYRDGSPCELCLTRGPLQAFMRNCTGEWPKSWAYAVRHMASLRTFRREVTLYAALTDFQKDKLIASGIPAYRIQIVGQGLTRGVDDEQDHIDVPHTKGYVGFLGRLSPEKGLFTLLQAARRLGDIPFCVAGAGDLSHFGEVPPNVTHVGTLSRRDVSHFLRECRFLVVPSLWYEGFPLVVIEAFGAGRPVLASRHGALEELVKEGETGSLFKPGDGEDLAAGISRLWQDPELTTRMGLKARYHYEEELTEEAYYERILRAYQWARHHVGGEVGNVGSSDN